MVLFPSWLLAVRDNNVYVHVYEQSSGERSAARRLIQVLMQKTLTGLLRDR